MLPATVVVLPANPVEGVECQWLRSPELGAHNLGVYGGDEERARLASG